MEIVLVVLAYILCLLIGFCIGRFSKKEKPEPPKPVVVDTGGPCCKVCGGPANPLRTHSGHYLCSTHKLTFKEN